MKPREMGRLLVSAVRHWWEADTFQLGAALAYYGIFAVAPILVVALAVAGMVFGEEAARGHLAEQLREVVGPAVAAAIEETLRSVHTTGSGWLATLLAVGVLLVAALGLFTQLQSALNTIWDVRPRSAGLWRVVRDRFWSFLLVLSIGGLLLASLIASAALTAASRFIDLSDWPGGKYLLFALHWLVLLGLLSVLFALSYKVLPDVPINWSDVWVGAGVTALLFAVGSYLIGLYLGLASPASAYGAAGSLVVVLLWIYYSSQVVLFGAEFTRAYAEKCGKERRPADNAEALPAEAQAGRGMEQAVGRGARA
jgi:membrane protein